MPRRSARAERVTAAGREIACRIGEWAKRTDQDDWGILFALGAHQVNLVRRATNVPRGFHGDMDGLDTILDTAQHEFELTTLEMLEIIAVELISTTRPMMRTERHPHNTERTLGADEAADDEP